MHPHYHALASVNRYGGKIEDYLPIHDWMDASKAAFADIRHRALRHHSEGIFWAEERFGSTLTNSDGRRVPVRSVAEDHVIEDLGFIPSAKDYLIHINISPWMTKSSKSQKLTIDLKEDK